MLNKQLEPISELIEEVLEVVIPERRGLEEEVAGLDGNKTRFVFYKQDKQMLYVSITAVMLPSKS